MRFEGISGNGRVCRQLELLEQSGRMPHALILEGADEPAREELARFLARWAVCVSSEEKPCGTCPACRKARSGSHPDIYVAQGANGPKSFHVDVIRTIRADAYIRPNEAPRKAYLLLGADAMTAQAQNALLKLLEEPPGQVLFVITCASAANLLETVRSRAQTFTLEDGEEEPEETPAADLAKKIASAVIAPREYELLCQTGKLAKDKELARGVVGRLLQIFRDACICGFSDAYSSAEEKEERLVAQRLPRARLLELLAVAEQAKDRMDQNANQNLLATWLCARLRSDLHEQ